jgi:hypothetical protein
MIATAITMACMVGRTNAPIRSEKLVQPVPTKILQEVV